jgi:hypothetical protein
MKRRRGYVLVMTLGLLMLSAALLVTVSRVAVRHSLAARGAVDDVQRRYATSSINRATLDHADTILLAAEQKLRKSIPKLATHVRLGELEYEIIVTDEQAKANINALLDDSDTTRTTSRLQQALTGSGLALNIRLRPTYGPIALPPAPVTQPATQPIYVGQSLHIAGVGQVFDGVSPARLIKPMIGSKLAPLDLLTFWGNGAVNARRTSAAALELAAGRSLTKVEVNRVIDARDKLYESRIGGGGEALDAFTKAVEAAAGESAKNRGNLGLVNSSRVFSVWVIARNKQREWYDWFVLDKTNERRPVKHSMSW